MHFAQHYLDCLSQASYLIGDTTTGQAVVVDPRRDVAAYLDDAAQHGLTVVGVINTHFHADFLAGHLELARATGAWIGYGRAAVTEYPVRHLGDGERIELGEVALEIMETPGHTPESISVLVHERSGDAVPYGVLTGDALFIGDVGRPDLLASVGVTADELAAMLHHSVQTRLMGLPDEVRVFPAHGAGSACGKNLSTERQSTIGEQRRTNYACRPMDVAEFTALVTAGQSAAPAYFGYDADLNRRDRAVLDADRQVPALDAAAVREALADGVVVLDARSVPDFSAGHLNGAQNVPADGRFAETAGMVLDPQDRIVLVTPDGAEQETAVRLARIGFDGVVGHLADPETALVELADLMTPASRITPVQLDRALAQDPAPVLVDVRNPGEVAGGAVPGALHIPLAQLDRRLAEIPTDRPVVAYCAGGWRSSVAASLLRRRGHADVSDVLGGYGAWDAARTPA